MEEPNNLLPPPSNSVNDGPSSSTVSSSSSSSSLLPPSLVQEEEQDHNQEQPQPQPQPQPSVSYRVNISISDVVASTEIRDEAWSCIVVLVTFWFFASMTLILGFYGSVNLRLGPNCSRLVQANSFFVHDIKIQEVAEPKPGPVLYGFYRAPPLDVESIWFETHNTSVLPNFHKEWIYFLNKGSQINISYSVKSQSSSPLFLVVAQGRESLVEWIDDPSYPHTTLSWNVIHGDGVIQQNIFQSSDYYVAVGNLNSEDVEVQLNIGIRAFIYNTTKAYYKCSPNHKLCSLKLFLFGVNAAVLTSPGPEEFSQVTSENGWYVKLLYGPRWITYFIGSGVMTILVLLAFKIFSKYQPTIGNGTRIQSVEVGSERAPLLTHKDDDLLSWGSSYDSVSNDDEDLEDLVSMGSHQQKLLKDGETHTNPRRLCTICCDEPRDCFFLPCGHCAACFTCGTRIAEEAGTCPICRRKMKKVRKIFAV